MLCIHVSIFYDDTDGVLEDQQNLECHATHKNNDSIIHTIEL